MQMSRNDVPSDGTNKLRKTDFTESFAKTSGEAFLSAVQMWKCQCNEFLVTVLVDTADCWPTKLCWIRIPFPLPLRRFRGSSKTYSVILCISPHPLSLATFFWKSTLPE